MLGKPRVALLTSLVLAVLAIGAARAVSASAVTAQQAIASLNAQRESNGLPGGIVEDSEWSEGCRLHEHYVELNGTDLSDPHDEDPSKPGFTQLGQTAARSSVLGASFGADGSNGWERAPIHLMQLLGPGLSITGYADGCMWTWPGYQRVAPEQTALYSYPHDTSIYYEETTSEWPFTPGAFVGLSEGSTTGPYLYVFAFGQSVSQVRLTAASLVGPDGPVEVRTVDNTTSGPQGNVGAYLPPGGILIPVARLRPDSLYNATATGLAGEQALNWAWSFRTISSPKQDPALWIGYHGGRLALAGSSDAPASLTVTRLPSGQVALRMPVNPLADPTVGLNGRLIGGRYEACADQAASDRFSPGHVCVRFVWREPPGVHWGRSLNRGGRVRLLLRAGHASGRLARLVLQAPGQSVVTRRLRLSSSLAIWVARGSKVNLAVSQFALGDRLFAATRLVRFVR